MTAAVADPRTAPYRAYGAGQTLWRDRSAEVVLSGPAGTGKSRACLEKLHACCLRWPGTRALIVRKTRESLSESGLVTFEEKVLPPGSPILKGPMRKLRQTYRYPNGSVAVVGGMDKPSKVMSTEFDLIYVQEAIELTENDWESLTTRLRNGVMPYQQMIADTNPDAPTHWLRRRATAGRTAMHESRHEDNPAIWDAARGEWTELGTAYIDKLDRLTGVRYYRLRRGQWVAAEGVVYDGFDRAIHVVDRMPDGWREWRKIRSIDFGFTNPFVCQWWAIDGDGRMYLYREVYRTGRIVSDHAVEIKELSAADGRIEATVADHDAEDRATLHKAGIPTSPAHKAITPGIDAVQKRLRVAGDGRPRLYVLASCLAERDPDLDDAKKPAATLEEFDSYVWPKGQDGKAVKEVPVDDSNHGMDAMRYAVAYLDLVLQAGAPGGGGPSAPTTTITRPGLPTLTVPTPRAIPAASPASQPAPARVGRMPGTGGPGRPGGGPSPFGPRRG